MVKAYIALGSNLNTPVQQLNEALLALSKLPDSQVLTVSSFYRSRPHGPQDQPDYVNAVACVQTPLSPLALLDALQQIENEQGRVRTRRWGERTLDLDILLYADELIHSERLTVPHYDMQNREFVIVPLYEIAPDLVLPSGIALSTLIKFFSAHSMQKLAN